MTYRLAALARCDLQELSKYIGKRNPAAAENLLGEIFNRFELIGSQPAIGAPREDLLEGMRHTVVGRYVIYYRSTNKGVDILRVIHGSRDIDAIEFE
jgi:toxin ParE1/3/4